MLGAKMKVISEYTESENYKKIDRVTLDTLCDTLKSHLLKSHFEEYLKKCEKEYKMVSLPSTVVLYKKRNLSKNYILKRMLPLSSIDTDKIISQYSFYIDTKTLDLHMCKKDFEAKTNNYLPLNCKAIKPQHHRSYCRFIFFYYKVDSTNFILKERLPINEESYEKLKAHYFQEVENILKLRDFPNNLKDKINLVSSLNGQKVPNKAKNKTQR